MAHFHIENLTFSYPGASVPVLDNISLDFEKGEYIVLCGKSGSGKSTLLRHLKSVLTPHGKRSGEILFGGIPLSQVSEFDQAGKIGFVMQNPEDQIVTDKVWHELAFGLENLGTDPGIMRLRIAEMVNFFGIQNWFHRDVAALSGGQKQLLNLAAIMAMQPEVLILDEPASQLDPIAASDFLSTVRKINIELGTTVIITEHRLEDILPCADQVVVMDHGKLLTCGDPRTVSDQLWQHSNELFSALPTPVRAFYGSGGSGRCPLTVREGRTWLSKAFESQPLSAAALPENRPVFPAGTPVISMKDIWHRYERNSPDVLRGVRFSVPTGCIHAIVGGNGTGKSTLLKAISGIVKPYRGTIELFGKPLKKYRSEELFQGCLCMLPQDPRSLFVKKTVLEELEEMSSDPVKIQNTAALCEINHLLHKHPWDLSGGEQQRTALAKVLLTEPKLLLLDEPTKGLDSFFKQQFAAILDRLKSRGVTILMVSHDIEFCAQYADQVSIFFDGQILTTDTPRCFFGRSSFYTTAASRMSRCVFENAVTAEDIVQLYRANRERMI